jgi:hypothetical protein
LVELVVRLKLLVVVGMIAEAVLLGMVEVVVVEFSELLFVAFPNCPLAPSTWVLAIPRKLKEIMRRQIIDPARSALIIQQSSLLRQ